MDSRSDELASQAWRGLFEEMGRLFEQMVSATSDPAALAGELFARLGPAAQADFLADGAAGLLVGAFERALSAALERFVAGGSLTGRVEQLGGLMAGHLLLGRAGRPEPAAAGFARLFGMMQEEEAGLLERGAVEQLGEASARYLDGYLTSLLAAGRPAAEVVDVAVELVDFGGLEMVVEKVTREPALIEALEARAADTERAVYRRSLYVELAERLLREGPPGPYREFLERQVDDHPRLLDPLIDLAREAEDWPRLLELARRGLTLREDRLRYNQLAAEALEAMGRALP